MQEMGENAKREIMMKSTFDFAAFNIEKHDRALKLDKIGRPTRWELKLNYDWDTNENTTCCQSQ